MAGAGGCGGRFPRPCAHRMKHEHDFNFVVFVSIELGMCGRLNSLVCNDRLTPSGDSGSRELL